MDGCELQAVLAAQGGDREAFGRLVEAHWVRCVRLARSVVGWEDAEDAVQDAFLKAWSRLPRLRAAAAFRSWLDRIVVRLCVSRARRRRFFSTLDGVGDPGQIGDLDSPIDLERLLRSLAPRQRAVLHLTVVEGATDSEIAELLEISPAGVRSHRRRARESLQRRLNGGAV